jgi:hypothetical protein
MTGKRTLLLNMRAIDESVHVGGVRRAQLPRIAPSECATNVNTRNSWVQKAYNSFVAQYKRI